MNSQNQIEQIHASGKQIVLAVTGGGSGAIAALVGVPGASASVLEAVVPYASTALEDWLGGPVDHYCSERTARAMAMAAFERAQKLSDADPSTLRGIGATASLASTRPKRGAHRIHVARQSLDTTAVISCELPKGERTRAEEEQIAAQLVLNVVADACGVKGAKLHVTDAVIQGREQHAPPEWSDLLLGRCALVPVATSTVSTFSPTILFPGAFNPIHEGHRRMAALAAKKFARPVTFELSIANVDKPPLDFIEIGDRLAQFESSPVLLTRAATFVEKARLVPGCIFVVGADTIERIAAPVYYGGDESNRDAAVAEIAEQGCRFLVYGRQVDGTFFDLSAIKIPPSLRKLCEQVPENEFREDISSTELRNR